MTFMRRVGSIYSFSALTRSFTGRQRVGTAIGETGGLRSRRGAYLWCHRAASSREAAGQSARRVFGPNRSISLIVISGLFSIFYYAGPNRHAPEVQWVSVGGVLATGAFTLASLGLVLCDEVQFIREDLRYLCRRCYPHLLALSNWVSGARWWRGQCGTRAPSSRSK
jgi:hypothetical protein